MKFDLVLYMQFHHDNVFPIRRILRNKDQGLEARVTNSRELAHRPLGSTSLEISLPKEGNKTVSGKGLVHVPK